MDDVAASDTHQSGLSPNNSHDNDDFKIKGAARREAKHGKPRAAVETCVICLESITERAVASPCNHLAFDFICLVSWLQNRKTCPLCNARVVEVQYEWRDSNDYQTYKPPQLQLEKASADAARQARRGASGQSSPANSRRSISARERQFLVPGATNPLAAADPSLTQRRRVYQENMPASHIGANSVSRYREFTPQDFATNPSLQSRARTFLRRELQVFTHLDTSRSPSNREFLIEYIVAVLKKSDPKGADGRAEDFVAEFLQRGNARLLLHELNAWLRSPYATLREWDRQVQYVQRPKDDSLR